MCENLGDHLVGHVYIKFEDEEDAAEALQVGIYSNLNGANSSTPK